MKASAIIESIDNGFIVDTESGRNFYPSLEGVVEALIVEPIRDADKMHREHVTVGCKYRLIAQLEDIEPPATAGG